MLDLTFTSYLFAPSFLLDNKGPNFENWASTPFQQLFFQPQGYPPISMLKMPCTLGRLGARGYDHWAIGLYWYIGNFAIWLHVLHDYFGCFGYTFKWLYGMYIIWLYCYMAHRLYNNTHLTT